MPWVRPYCHLHTNPSSCSWSTRLFSEPKAYAMNTDCMHHGTLIRAWIYDGSCNAVFNGSDIQFSVILPRRWSAYVSCFLNRKFLHYLYNDTSTTQINGDNFAVTLTTPSTFEGSSSHIIMRICRVSFTVPPIIPPIPHSHLYFTLNFLSSWIHFLKLKPTSMSKAFLLQDGHAQMQAWIT